MTKEEALQNWQRGDDSECAVRVKRKFGVTISKQAIRAWRIGGPCQIESLLIWGMRSIQTDRFKQEAKAKGAAATR